jgi:hypothetical protein
MAIMGWPSNVSWAKFRKLSARPSGAKVDAHIEGYWENPPGKLFKPTKGPDGWRLENINIAVRLKNSQTWVVNGKEGADLLKHEQGHWNLLGLIVRELHAKLEALRAPTASGLGPLANRATRHAQAKADKVNRRYDKETNHSLNKANQLKWDSLIASRISSGKHLPDG